MSDAPEIVLNRALAQLLRDHGLAVYQPTGTIPDRGIRLDGIMRGAGVSPTIRPTGGLTARGVFFFSEVLGGPEGVERGRAAGSRGGCVGPSAGGFAA